MWYQKKLFVLAELSVTAAILRTQAKASCALFFILTARLPSPVPIRVSEINPEAPRGLQNFSCVCKNIHKLRDEFLWLLLKSKLSSHTVVALTIEGRRRYDAVREDTSLAQPTQYLTHFAAKYQTTLVGVESLLFEGP